MQPISVMVGAGEQLPARDLPLVTAVTAPVAPSTTGVAAGAHSRVHLECGCGHELCRGYRFAGRELVGPEYRQ